MMKDSLNYALNYALNKGFQIHPDAFKILENIDFQQLKQVIKEVVREKAKQNQFLISQEDLEVFLGIKKDVVLKNEYRVLFDPTAKITSVEGIEGFSVLFLDRFTKLKKIVSHRPEAKLVKSISLVISSKSENGVYVCGLVSEKNSDRNVARLRVDDPTGSLEILIFDKDLQKTVSELLMDQFVMLRVVYGKNGGFIAKDVIVPDIPEHASNRSETETYAVFLSDLHVGSKFFMENEFDEFVSWLSSPDPIARKIRFIVIAGDIMDGIGIYPNQEKELVFQTVESQLQKLYQVLEKVPQDIKIFLVPGNHDPGRRALPQPAFPKKHNKDLWGKENLVLVGNPSLISLNGVKVLVYHGQSFDDIVKITPGLSYDKPAAVMRHLLRARHLSPIYGSQTPTAPEIEDMLVIDEVPDIFHVGHVHVVGLDTYRGILLVNSGTWQRQTPFQASVGVVPTPAIAVIVNLKTFKVFYKNFNE